MQVEKDVKKLKQLYEILNKLPHLVDGENFSDFSDYICAYVKPKGKYKRRHYWDFFEFNADDK
jgi:hypothetical protein